MPAPCSLLLQVYHPISIYDDTIPTVEWEISSDPDHPFPLLLEPRNYAAQEIDPITCAATIGTVEVGALDVPDTLGDQTTGFITARIHSLLGRRCRLRRWVGDESGWVVIADGPAGVPKLDTSYAAYRWTIRDTRDVERKLSAFGVGGVAAVIPNGPIYGFGEYTDDDGDQILLQPRLEVPITGIYELSSLGAYQLGLVNLAMHYSSGGADDARLVMSEAAATAIQISEVVPNAWGARNADLLWRKEGTQIWNTARPTAPLSLPQPFVGTIDALILVDGDGKLHTCADYVTMFVAPSVPEGMQSLSPGDRIQIIVRYRGPANDDYPYYVEGPLGLVLENLYNGVYSKAPMQSIEGFIYDPLELDSVSDTILPRIGFDPTVFATMTEHVMLRQTEPVDDVRGWTETNLYAPSGWIPSLDADMMISPTIRTAPESVSDGDLIDDGVTSPVPDWQTGDRTVSEVNYAYNRFFVPPNDDLVTERKPDGLSIRAVEIAFDDVVSELRYGTQLQEYDASAFSSVGTSKGITIPGQLEAASILCQKAKFDVLDRYRAGVQSAGITVLRSRIPSIRVGDWLPVSLMYLPDRTTGLRGSNMPIAQVVSLRDDDCTWRTLIVEESPAPNIPPGLVVALSKTGDEPSAGGITLRVLSDVESY